MFVLRPKVLCTRLPASSHIVFLSAGVAPELFRDRSGVDLELPPPGPFIAAVVQLTMVCTAERDGVLVADLAAERSRLGEAEVVRIARRAAADEAGLGGHEVQVVLVALADRLADGQRNCCARAGRLGLHSRG